MTLSDVNNAVLTKSGSDLIGFQFVDFMWFSICFLVFIKH